MSRCCGFVVKLVVDLLYSLLYTTDPQKIEVVEFGLYSDKETPAVGILSFKVGSVR